MTETLAGRFNFTEPWYAKVHFGGGFEALANDNIGFFFNLDYNYLMSDRLDDIEQGRYNDFYWRGNIGLNIYIGKKVKGNRKFSYGKEKDFDF